MTAQKKILVVDDEPDVLNYLDMLLQDNGYETVTASDGKDALEKFQREKPDLVVLDISMPGKSGAGFYKDVKQDPESKSIPVIIVTAITGIDGDPKAYEKFISSRLSVPPPEGYFSKPIEKEAFIAKVGELLQA